MYGYLTTETASPFNAKSTEMWDRIRNGGKWNMAPCLAGDLKGILYWLNGSPEQRGMSCTMPRDMLTECPCGYWFSDGVIPRIGDLAKERVPDSITLTLACGESVSIPMATFAHYKIDFTNTALGELKSDYARAALAIDDKMQSDEDMTAADFINLAYHAIAEAYHVTPELMTAMELISTADLVPLYHAVWGIDPKSLSSEGDT